MINSSGIDNKKNYLGKILFIISLFVLASMIALIILKPFFVIDEWFTRGIVQLPVRGMIDITARDVHPPLYYLIVMIPLKILNRLHISYDLVSVIKLMSVVPYFFVFGISITKIRKEYGWLTGGLFALTAITMSAFFESYSTARMYSWGLLFLLLAFLCAGEILKENNLKHWILLSVFSACGAYVHYFVAMSAFVLYFLLLVRALLNNRSEIKNWLISTVLSVLFFSPWLMVVAKQVSTIDDSYWIPEITFKVLCEFFGSVFITSENFAINLVLTVAFLAFLALVFMQFRKSEENSEFVLLGTLVFVGTLVIGTVASYLLHPIMVARYLVPAVTLVWLSFSIFIDRFDFKKVIIPVVIVILLLSAFNLYTQIDGILDEHEEFVEDEMLLDSINNNDSVVIIMGMAKYVHCYSGLDNTTVYSEYSVGDHEKVKGFAKNFDDKKYKFCIPDDLNKYKDKKVYLIFRKGTDLSDLPSNISLDTIGKIKNCKVTQMKTG